jgi:hypothetical protein
MLIGNVVFRTWIVHMTCPILVQSVLLTLCGLGSLFKQPSTCISFLMLKIDQIEISK